MHNLASLRALDADLRGMLATWLGPACLELKQITWNDAAGLLEKIVAYEAGSPPHLLFHELHFLQLVEKMLGTCYLLTCVLLAVETGSASNNQSI